MFHFGTFTIAQVKAALARAGLPVRLPRQRGVKEAAMAKAVKKRPENKRKKLSKPKKLRKPGKRVAVRRETTEVPRPPPPLALGPAAVVLDRLWSVVMSRRTADPAVSHSARLLSRGTAKVAQKFGEEAVECLIEAVAGNRDAVVAESADVLYHLIVLWVASRHPPRRGLGGAEAPRGHQRHCGEGQPCAGTCRLRSAWRRRKSPDPSQGDQPWLSADCRLTTTSNIFARILRGEIPSKKATRMSGRWRSTTSTRRRRRMCW